MDKKFYAIFILILVVVGGGIYWAATIQEKGNGGGALASGTEVVAFAQCLNEKGATFYGAWWCPHCAEQKSLFGETAMEQVDYVECSPPSGQGQTQICIEKQIKSYPTWIFADGSRATGVLSFETLAGKTGCLAPGATSTTPIVDTGMSTSSRVEANSGEESTSTGKVSTDPNESNGVSDQKKRQ